MTEKKSLSLGKKRAIVLSTLSGLVLLVFLISLFVGSSHMSIKEGILGLFGQGETANIIIMQNIVKIFCCFNTGVFRFYLG